MAEIKTKKCRKCGRELPLGSFNLCSTSKDGHSMYCRDCFNKYQRERKDVRKHAKEINTLEQNIAEVPDNVIISEFTRRGFKLIEGNIYKAY